MFLVSALLDLAAKAGGPRLQHRLFLYRAGRWNWGEPEWHLLDHLIDPLKAAVDIGASHGFYAGRLSQLCPRVHAFEPNPKMARRLLTTMPGNVAVHEIALSDRAGTAELRVPATGDGEPEARGTLEARNELTGMEVAQSITCRIARLDDVLNEPIGFIKIDAEGHELAVLRGARRILSDQRPSLIVESDPGMHPEAPHNVFSELSEIGYAGAFLHEGRLCGLGRYRPGLANNFIFFADR
jgi:FkbM family methyltransferase